MKTIRLYTLLALLLMAGGVSMQVQAQKPFRLQVGATGYANWINPDYLEQTVFDLAGRYTAKAMLWSHGVLNHQPPTRNSTSRPTAPPISMPIPTN